MNKIAYLSYPAGTEVFPGYREDDDRSVLVIATASQKFGYSDWQIQKVIDKDFDGEPLIDTARLLKDGILSVYIQEHGPYPDGPALATPLHVYDFQTGRR
ncbi:hypothetical protein IEN85_04905 [Pelagicoccus sp. NFK12]|uniref:Uncharacterized protein n=1 Tax=Pelagicoccus enzymogenes TaxID=2773457 RepID=A0A927F7Y0_9BACT|nr:hypothetical protein [Pelagicoccus enzymogenes]MBD5778820.1 hypothetical protein [Pelagicoccus enzymogenes]